jgi:hypothetical protein
MAYNIFFSHGLILKGLPRHVCDVGDRNSNVQVPVEDPANDVGQIMRNVSLFPRELRKGDQGPRTSRFPCRGTEC